MDVIGEIVVCCFFEYWEVVCIEMLVLVVCYVVEKGLIIVDGIFLMVFGFGVE